MAEERARGGRRVLVGVLGVLATVLVFATILAWWAHSTLLDTDSWVATVGPLAEDPTVTDPVAEYLTAQLIEVTDTRRRVADLLPDRAEPLAGPLTDAIGGALEARVAELLASPTFAELWVGINRHAHAAAVAVLRDDTGGRIRVEDGTVTLNLLPLLARALAFVDDSMPGLVDFEGPVPEILPDQPVDEAVEQLEATLGRDLPADLAQVEVFRSDQLAAAQAAVLWFDRLVWAMAALTLALLVATVVLAPERRGAITGLAIGIVSATLLASAGIGALRRQVLDLISTEQNRRAAAAAIRQLLADLALATRVVFWAGLAVGIAAFLLGDHPAARAFRRAVRRIPGAPEGDLHPWIAERRRDLQVVGLAVGLAVVVFGAPTWTTLALTFGAVALWCTLVAVTGRARPAAVEPRAGA